MRYAMAAAEFFEELARGPSASLGDVVEPLPNSLMHVGAGGDI